MRAYKKATTAAAMAAAEPSDMLSEPAALVVEMEEPLELVPELGLPEPELEEPELEEPEPEPELDEPEPEPEPPVLEG